MRCLLAQIASLCFLVTMYGARMACAQEPTAPFPRQGDYVGAERCEKCHDRQFQRLQRGVHGVILLAEALPGCETCHGPGKQHSDDADNDPAAITMPAKFAGNAQIQFCGRCHREQIEHHGGDGAGLWAAGKVCTDCHEVHERRGKPVLSGMKFRARAEAVVKAEAIGSQKCLECHPLRDELLLTSAHAALASAHDPNGCEDCHGPGSLHESTNGESRLITRPDRAVDGVTTCRSCHAGVDPVQFHWLGRQQPFFSSQLTCTTCHRIHVAKNPPPAVGSAVEAATNRVCAQCHTPALCSMPGSAHAQLGSLETPLALGCGACHAGGLDHALAGGRRSLVQAVRGTDAATQARICLACHRDAEALLHVRQGSHFRNGVGCLDCHAPIHGATRAAVAATAEQHCEQCHADVAAQFALPNHHPVPEDRMRCSSCHEVHGARPQVRDLVLREGRCVECHRRYQGPFVFAHQAGRRDGCVVCHVPHGSANRRLLQQATTQQNCTQCHGDFPAFHDQTRGAVFTDCLRCHTEVHGSNHDRFLFR